MAESSLSIGFPELKAVVGKFIGHGSVDTSPAAPWTAAHVTEIEDLVQSGVRRVYYPLPATADTIAHEWSFLKPTTTLAIIVDDGDYDFPDDFGRLVGDFHYAADEHRPSIVIISIGTLLDMRSRWDLNGYPEFAAIRYKASTGATGSRQEVLFYPEPDASYTLSYEYEAYHGVLSDTYPYPLGGMQLAELYIESCLAVAESRLMDEPGVHTQQYQVLLTDAIARDRKHDAKNFGQMGNVEPEMRKWRRGQGLYDGSYSITYDGNQI